VSDGLRAPGQGTSSGRSGPRLVPILGWLRSYDRRWLRGDLIAGMTVAALIVPKNLGYAEIAGIPVQNGLYAAAAGAILYAIFGTCRQISMCQAQVSPLLRRVRCLRPGSPTDKK